MRDPGSGGETGSAGRPRTPSRDTIAGSGRSDPSGAAWLHRAGARGEGAAAGEREGGVGGTRGQAQAAGDSCSSRTFPATEETSFWGKALPPEDLGKPLLRGGVLGDRGPPPTGGAVSRAVLRSRLEGCGAAGFPWSTIREKTTVIVGAQRRLADDKGSHRHELTGHVTPGKGWGRRAPAEVQLWGWREPQPEQYRRRHFSSALPLFCVRELG